MDEDCSVSSSELPSQNAVRLVTQPLDPKDPDSTTMPVIAYKDRRRAAIEQSTAVVREASAKATQVTAAKPRHDLATIGDTRCGH